MSEDKTFHDFLCNNGKDGDIWQNKLSFEHKSGTYEFHLRKNGKWEYIGRFKDWLSCLSRE